MEEEGEKGMESLFKQIVDENFLNLRKELDPQIQEAKRTPNYLNQKILSPRHVVLKCQKLITKKNSQGSQEKEESNL